MADAVVVLLFAVLFAGCVYTARTFLRHLRRHLDRRTWEELVARHQELDHELDKIWQRR